MVYIFIADGFEEIEVMTIIDILRRADIDTKLVSVDGYELIGAHGIRLLADIHIGVIDEDNMKMLVLPGGMPGTTNLENSLELIGVIKRADKNNVLIAAICAAPMVLGKLKLLEGKKATCYPGFEKHLIGAKVVERKVIKDKNIITSRGPGTASDFAFKIVEVLKNKEISIQLKEGMLYGR
ncbi:MAG: DJ-1 family glyoxalase III [Alkaliphilus sp.]